MIISSCAKTEIREKMDVAERIVAERPDSALSVLLDLDERTIKDTEDKARYNLLLAIAYDKNWMPIENESGLEDAAAFFSKDTDSRYYMLSQYYLGAMRMNKGIETRDYLDCLCNFLNSEKAAKSLNDDFYSALSKQSLCFIFQSIYDSRNELKYALETYNTFKKINKEPHASYAMLDVASAYNNNDSSSMAIEWAKKAIKSGMESQDSLLLRSAFYTLGNGYTKSGYNDSVITIMEKKMEMFPTYMSEKDIYILGLAYYNSGDMEKAKMCNNLLLEQNDNFKGLDDIIAAKNHDYERAYESLKSAEYALDSILTKVFSQQISKNMLEYHEREEEQQAQVIATQRREKWMLGGGLVLVIALGGVVAYFKRRQHRMEKRNMELTIKDFANELARVSSSLSSMRSGTGAVLGERAALVDRLCSAYFDDSGEEKKGRKAEKSLVDEVSNYIKELRTKGDALKQMEAALNKGMNDVIKNFRADFPKLADEDYLLFILSALGFSQLTIGNILSANRKSVYNRRYRLRHRIESSDCRRREEYLGVIGG